MACLQIEGDLEGVRAKQIEFLRDVLSKRGFVHNRVVFAPACNAGDNYAANVKRISVVVENGQDFKIIAKFAPENMHLRMAMNTAAMFNNESLMYEQVLPKLVNLQKVADVPEKNWLRYAECYGCLTEEPNEVILLQDLKELDFVMLDRKSCIDDETVRLILKNFAIYHSLSYAMKKLQPDTYESWRNKLVDIWSIIVTPEEFKGYLAPIESSAIELVDEKYKNSLRGAVTRMPDLVSKLKKTENTSKNLVIQQGDAWINNTLFKLKNDAPAECIMIDFQMSRENNPVCDILNVIFNCKEHETRAKHYLDWIDYYHEQLDRSLSDFGMKANYVFPKEQLDADLKRYSKVYFGIVVMHYESVSKTREEAKAVQDSIKDFDAANIEMPKPMETLSSNTMMLFKNRTEGLIDSYRLFGYM